MQAHIDLVLTPSQSSRPLEPTIKSSASLRAIAAKAFQSILKLSQAPQTVMPFHLSLA